MQQGSHYFGQAEPISVAEAPQKTSSFDLPKAVGDHNSAAALHQCGVGFQGSWTGQLALVDEELIIRLFHRLLSDDIAVKNMTEDSSLDGIGTLLGDPSSLHQDLNPSFIARALLFASDLSTALPYIFSSLPEVGAIVRIQGRITRLRIDERGFSMHIVDRKSTYSVRFDHTSFYGAPIRNLIGKSALALGFLESHKPAQIAGATLMLKKFGPSGVLVRAESDPDN